MLNGVQGTNNYQVAFQGIGAKTIQQFIPEIGEEAAAHLSKYFDAELPADEFRYIADTVPTRFMHKKEIIRLFSLTKQQGVTLIPTALYFKGSRVKMEIGLCKGKKLYDKRESDAKRDANRMIQRTMKGAGSD